MQQLGWIYFSPSFKDKINSILDLLDQEEGMVDELGLGRLRDAYADLFFPGTSTVQTRAKYFFIVSYLIKDFFLQNGGKSKNLEQYLNEEEHKIIWELAEKYNHDRNARSGVIGITKHRNQKLARRPSSIYWNGLRSSNFNFIDTELSLHEYYLNADKILEELLFLKKSIKDDSSDDQDIEYTDNHRVKVSTRQKGWRESLDLPLSYEEADFFLKRILEKFPKRLIGKIASMPTLRKSFLDTTDFESFSKLCLQENIGDELKKQITQAHDLNEITKGLHLAYSHMINKKHYLSEVFLEDFELWRKNIYDNLVDLNSLTKETIQQTTNIDSDSVLTFMQSILSLIKKHQTDIEDISELIINQEIRIKGKKARLRAGAQRDFEQGKSKSLSRLNYRDGNARIIIGDIFTSLNQ
jgi:hypothetical protein